MAQGGLGWQSGHFLTGEAQRAWRVLALADFNNYAALKTALLAHYGHNLPTWVHLFYSWAYDVHAPVIP